MPDVTAVHIEGGTDPHPDHDHASEGQEEVYVVLRKIVAGPDGIRLLAIGGVPGRAYAAPGYTELGAPDPLAA